MKTASTVETASVVAPKTSVSSRIQTPWYTSPLAPDATKHASGTASLANASPVRSVRAPELRLILRLRFLPVLADEAREARERGDRAATRRDEEQLDGRPFEIEDRHGDLEPVRERLD